MKEDLLDDSVGFFLGQAYRRLVQTLTILFKPYDMTPEQFTVLVRLNEQDGINQKELAQRSGKDQPTLTRILDLLERKHLIRKQTHQRDRRAFLLFVTEEGRHMVMVLSPIEREHQAAVFAGIDPAEQQQFKQTLLKMMMNTEQMKF